MQYFLKIAKLFSILLLLALTLVVGNTNMSLSPPIIILVANQAHAATASPSYSSGSDNATITKIQSINNSPPLPAPPAIIHRNTRAPPAIGGPTLNDPNLKVELVVDTGLKRATSMAFLGPNDILVLAKNTGNVYRIINGKMLPEPLLDVNVANEAERGLLGIAIAKGGNGNTNTENEDSNGNIRHVFLYYTESGGGKDGDDAPNNATNTSTSGIAPAGNRLYRYDLDLNNNNNIKLINPKLLLNLPASPPPERAGTEKNHNGGKVLIGPDNNVYIGIGDVAGHRGQSENNPNGPAPDGTGGILRVTQDGQIVDNPPLGSDTIPLSLYYAYGMRNTFGMDFDPVTGNLWDTENGPTYGDEINLVQPGFNSGWRAIQGFWETTGNGNYYSGRFTLDPTGLIDFGGKGKYRSPEFVWNNTSGPTAIKFLNSDKLGKEYQNDMFVADFHGGNIYHFKLNEDRTGLVLDGPLEDKIANTSAETQQGGIIFAKGFGSITDLEVGPYDGYLYVLTFDGTIYRILPLNSDNNTSESSPSDSDNLSSAQPLPFLG
jgi:aldose sugar dehydrogenase